MKRDYHRWYSSHLHRDMELLVFGHAGAKVLMFPTREGRFYEYENLGIVQSLAGKVEAGQLQLFCIEGLAGDSFYNRQRTPEDRLRRHAAFEAYVLDEVLTFMNEANPHECIIAQGCSLGAFQAASIAFRHPQRFRKLVAFSGRFDLTWRVEHFDDLLHGFYNEDVYFHMPTHFLPRLTNEALLFALRRMDIVLVIGREDPFLENNHTLSRILNDKGVRHHLYHWDGRAHRASAWRKMAPIYI